MICRHTFKIYSGEIFVDSSNPKRKDHLYYEWICSTCGQVSEEHLTQAPGCDSIGFHTTFEKFHANNKRTVVDELARLTQEMGGYDVEFSSKKVTKSLDARILEALAPFEGRKATTEVMEEMGNAVMKVFRSVCSACRRTESVAADLQKDCNGVYFCGECAKHYGSW
jgi:hypothetical protein